MPRCRPSCDTKWIECGFLCWGHDNRCGRLLMNQSVDQSSCLDCRPSRIAWNTITSRRRGDCGLVGFAISSLVALVPRNQTTMSLGMSSTPTRQQEPSGQAEAASWQQELGIRDGCCSRRSAASLVVFVLLLLALRGVMMRYRERSFI